VPDPLETLRDRVREVHALERGGGWLRWDQEVVMPPGGTRPRAEERAAVRRAVHQRWTADATRRAIEDAADHAQSPPERALVREARREHERRARVPDDLVHELGEATARAHTDWVDAKQDADPGAFLPALERVLDLHRRRAEHIAPDRDPYAVLYEDYEPWLPWEAAEPVLAELVTEVEHLVDALGADRGPTLDEAFPGTWPVDEQRALSAHLAERLGLDPEHGRLDTSAHPFTTGNPYDARITTRLDPEDPLTGLTSTVHELGHALYALGLPEEHLGTPAGRDRGLTVHEANARLWENHVARSPGFWRWLTPILEDRFGKDLDAETCWRAATRVDPSPIRVDADEVTYHLHIAVRVHVESRLVRGELAVEDAPKRFHEQMDRRLGLAPDTSREGFLQDVHWAHGSFGYFPTYSLGSCLAAQLADAIEADVGPLNAAAGDERLDEVRAWLTEQVHRHGQRYRTAELVERATGRELGADALVDRARSLV
jgi:carboxypeptidase Taq